jgi:hypothetical protein
MSGRDQETGSFWGIVRLTANEAAEESGDDGLRDDDLVVNRSPLKMEKLHADRLGLEDVADVIRVDSVLADEPLEDMETLWSELINTALLEEVRCGIDGVLDEAGIHEMLTHGLCHLTGHGESGGRCGCNDTGRFPWVRPAI